MYVRPMRRRREREEASGSDEGKHSFPGPQNQAIVGHWL